MVATKTKAQSGSRRRASASKAIPKAALEKVQLSLSGLPEKTRQGVPLREAVEQMQDVIVEALAKGYSYEDVASLLTEQGVDINAPSLKYHLSRLKKTKRTRAAKGTTGRKRRTKASDETVAEPLPASEAAAKKSTKTKTSTKAPSRRAAAKTKSTAAEASVAVEPTPAPASSEEKEASPKKQGARSAANTKASTKSATRSKATSKTPSSKSRKK
jgi:hypothetical protein